MSRLHRPPPQLPVVATFDLFRPLHAELLGLLRALPAAAWERPTVAGDWRVRDIVAHLLDGDLRRLSFHRDGHAAPPPEVPIEGYADLVDHINRLNHSWVEVARRFSPMILLSLIEQSGREVADFVEALDPFAPGLFPVGWAGEEASLNWMDIGREYTERWHHQQQVREAVGAPLLLGARWMRPLLELSVRALPRAFQTVRAEPGTAVQIEIQGEGGGDWTLTAGESGWHLQEGRASQPEATVRLSTDQAWRIFYNAADGVPGADFELIGRAEFGRAFGATRSVMV